MGCRPHKLEPHVRSVRGNVRSGPDPLDFFVASAAPNVGMGFEGSSERSGVAVEVACRRARTVRGATNVAFSPALGPATCLAGP